MDTQTKKELGLIIIIIGSIFGFFLMILTARSGTILIGFGIIIVCILPGLGITYQTLDIKNQGFLLLILGTISFIITIITTLIIIYHFFGSHAIIITLFLIQTLFFFTFTFIIPGIWKVLKGFRLTESQSYFYALVPVFTFCISIYSFIIGAACPSSLTFLNCYKNFLGLGIMLSGLATLSSVLIAWGVNQ